MLSASDMAARLRQLQAVAEEADPDALVAALRPELEGQPSEGAATPARLRSQVTRLKFACTQAEARKRFVERMYSGDAVATLEAPTGLEEERRAAKEQNRAVKQRIAQEEESHRRLRQELEATHASVAALRESCLAQVAAAAAELSGAAPPEGSPHGSPRGSPRGAWAKGAAGWPGERPHAEAERHAADASRAVLASREVGQERARLQRELHRVEAEANAHRRRANAANLELEQERKLTLSLESAREVEQRFGLPHMELDGASGSLVLGGAGGAAGGHDVDKALRTLGLRFDDGGRLVGAEAHPALRLQKEACRAIAADDPARLVTRAWDKVCEVSAVDAGVASRGGA